MDDWEDEAQRRYLFTYLQIYLTSAQYQQKTKQGDVSAPPPPEPSVPANNSTAAPSDCYDVAGSDSDDDFLPTSVTVCVGEDGVIKHNRTNGCLPELDLVLDLCLAKYPAIKLAFATTQVLREFYQVTMSTHIEYPHTNC